MNRLNQVVAAVQGAPVASYAYTLGAAGNRTSVAELSGRTVSYGYDALYRLTQESVSADPNGKNGTVSYAYDNVGNRQQMNSTLGAVPAGVFFYNNNDQLTTDTYDANGNTTASAGITSTYDFENHMVQKGAVAIVYDGDGNRVTETVGGVTTKYLVDTQNPTGYAQVVEELQNGAVAKSYSYGLERISQNWQPTAGNWQRAFYGYDGHGSVRFLTNSAGTITDTYDYDAFGNLTNQTGTTPNNYLFAGEQFDPALNLYYNRARYLNTSTGRFWSMDLYEGDQQSPASLHKYLYASNDAVDRIDPSGKFDMADVSAAIGVIGIVASQSIVAVQNVAYAIYFNLYRVPQLVDAASNALIFLQGTIEASFLAKNVIEQMASNLQNANGKFSAGPGPMGGDVEIAAGANLERSTQSYDYYDAQSQTVIQLKGTRQTASSGALMGVVKGALNNLDNAPEVVSTRYRSGPPVDIVRSNIKIRAVVVAIPTKPVSWNFRVFMQQIEQLEESEKVIIKIVPSPGLD